MLCLQLGLSQSQQMTFAEFVWRARQSGGFGCLELASSGGESWVQSHTVWRNKHPESHCVMLTADYVLITLCPVLWADFLPHATSTLNNRSKKYLHWTIPVKQTHYRLRHVLSVSVYSVSLTLGISLMPYLWIKEFDLN